MASTLSNNNQVSKQARQNTSGGSAGAGGYGFQAEVSAAVAAKILAGEPLNWVESACTQVPVEILAETGRGGDDLLVRLQSGAVIEVQAKKGIQKGVKLWTALTDLARAVSKNTRVYGVLLTDHNASQTIRNDLRRDLIRLGQGRQDDLRSITKEFLRTLDKAKLRDVEDCCARLRIVVSDYEPGSSGEELIRASLRGVVYDPSCVVQAHDALSKDGQHLIFYRGQRNKRTLENLLAGKNIAISTSAPMPRPVQEAIAQLTASLSSLSGDSSQSSKKLLAMETQALQDKVNEAWLSYKLEEVSVHASELRRWMSTYSNQLPDALIAEAYTLLIEVEFSTSSNALRLTASQLASVEQMLQQGDQALHRSPCNSTTEQRLFSLKSLIIAQTNSVDAGMAMLAGRDDPYAIRRRLTIWLCTDQFEEAAENIAAVPFHAEWVHKAAAAFAATGRSAQAQDAIRWAKSQVDRPFLAAVCAAAASNAAAAKVINIDKDELGNINQPLSPEEAIYLRQASEYLCEVTESIRVLGQVRSAPEMWALRNEAVILAYLRKHEALSRTISTLASWQPFPLIIAELARQEICACQPDWPERMRREYPDNFQVELLACLITPDNPENCRKEFQRLCDLARDARQHDLHVVGRQLICTRLQQLALGLDDDVSQQISTIENELLRDDDYARQTVQLVRAVNDGKLDEASALLDHSEATRGETDPLWIQCRAAIALRGGETDVALTLLRAAVLLTPHPGLLRYTANVALEANNHSEAASLLERYLERKPEDNDARHQLALLYIHEQEYTKATGQFHAIWADNTTDIESAVNYAASLAYCGELNESVRIYEDICLGDDPPLQAVLARSSVTKALGKPKEAFDKLIVFRTRWWDEPRYLMAVTELGYAAQEEDIGAEALAKVQSLQAEGRAEQSVVRSFTVDQAVEMFVSRRRTTEEVQGFVLRGQLPWLTVDRMLGDTAVGAWYKRTRQLTWVGEMPFAQSMAAVYATNGFYIDRRADRERAFRSFPGPQAASAVVADMSALLTLHQLGILDKAARFFGHIYLPSAYLPVALEDAGKLVLHQPSQKVALEAIQTATEAGRVSFVGSFNTDQARVSHLDDADWDEDTACVTYGLSDILPVLLEQGLITEAQMREKAQLMRKLSLVQTPLIAGQTLGADIEILKTLAGAGLLDPVLECFRVLLAEHERDTLSGTLAEYRRQEEMYALHRTFWERIRSDGRFSFVPYVARPRAATDDQYDRRQEVDIAAALLAQDKGLPLLADDRACQSFIYSDSASPSGCYAYGTDHLVSTWADSGLLTNDEAAAHHLQLIRWRYRFLLPSAIVLKAMALQHLTYPPGKELREVAGYLHDCMQDAGLPVEQASEMPTSTLANWLFIRWIGTTMEFICMLWTDETITYDQAEAYSAWAVRHLLPSPPRTVGQAGALHLRNLPTIVLTHGLIHLFAIKDTARGRRALKAISTALGLSNNEYLRVVSGALHVV